MTSRDLTIRGARHKLEELGFAPTSSSHPDRIVDTRFHHGRQRASWTAIAEHPAAIMCYPSEENGCELDDAAQRQIVLLTVTAYLLSDVRQSKAVMSVLDKYKLTSGPYLQKDFGDRIYPLQYNDLKNPLSTQRARLTHEDDDRTVLFESSVAPTRFDYSRVNDSGYHMVVALDHRGSHILPLDGGDWTNGHLLDTPRRNLPELFDSDLREIIGDVERARWEGRPAAAEAKRA